MIIIISNIIRSGSIMLVANTHGRAAVYLITLTLAAVHLITLTLAAVYLITLTLVEVHLITLT